jgi:transketolase
MDIQELKKKAAQLRIDTLRMINKSGSGHTGGSMSIMDIITALYYGPGASDDDYVVLSKGHGVPAQYAALIDKGVIDKDEENHLRQVGSLLQGHPSIKTPGITISSGSLGQGFSSAHGLAMGLKLDKKPNQVFAILGDGELQEGIIWEVAMSAGHFRTDNLVAIVDNNKLQIDGTVREVMNVEPIQSKFESFGWKVIQVTDGHSMEEVVEAIEKARKFDRQPVCLWCHTVKGQGVPFAENKASYHGVALSDEELVEAEKVINDSVAN